VAAKERSIPVVQGLIIVVVAALAHFTFHWAVPAIVWPDSQRYVVMSVDLPHRLLTSDWDHHTAPAYPLFLYAVGSWISTVKGVAVMQQGLGILTCWIVWFTARRLFGERAAFLAGLVVALSPFRHYYAETLLTESLGEFLLVTGVCSLLLAEGRPLGRMILLRSTAGAALGLASLTRPNLLPALVLGILAPVRPATDGGRKGGFTGIVVMTAVSLSVVGPWLAFNLNRGVLGVTGGAGLQLTLFSNEFGIGPAYPDRLLVHLGDGERQQVALARIARHPAAYVRGVTRSMVYLTIPARPRGDVAPAIPTCEGWASSVPLPRFDPGPPGRHWGWRCVAHASLSMVVAVLITVGWAGLVAWGVASLVAQRYPLAVIAAIPLACVVALALTLQGNTRYAYPLETLALGFGLPALGTLLGPPLSRGLRRLRHASLSRAHPP
jgi:Dolichyl-phosphate-mannose-protein mannosyltransferase